MTRNNEHLSVLLAIGDNWQRYSGKKNRTNKESIGRGLICSKKNDMTNAPK